MKIGCKKTKKTPKQNPQRQWLRTSEHWFEVAWVRESYLYPGHQVTRVGLTTGDWEDTGECDYTD